MMARRSRTFQYSSASLASSSCTWASYAVMPTPPSDEVGGALGPGFWACLRRLLLPRSRCRHVGRR
jgi:hypothetical protein